MGLINHCWLVIPSDDRLQDQVGLRYLSHMWDRHPYWYLWWRQCAGVYKLELHQAQPLAGYDWLAEFVIKYYPSEQEACFNGLSPPEQACRQSRAFHTLPADGQGGCPCHGLSSPAGGGKFADLAQGTGAPSFEYYDQIPVDYFYAGHLLVAFHSQRGTLVRVKSQRRWQTLMTADCLLYDDQGKTLATLSAGELARDYPGFDLSYFLYQKFLESWALFHQYPACHELVWQGDGVKFLSDGHHLEAETSREIQVIVAQTELTYRPEDQLPPVGVEDLAHLHPAVFKKEV